MAADSPLTSDLPGSVGVPTVDDLPGGYRYGCTRYADIILQQAFPTHYDDLCIALERFRVPFDAAESGGGNRSDMARIFDGSLQDRGWSKRNIRIEKRIDGRTISRVRGHEIDMFKAGGRSEYPGIGVEMEWNNKDPFFDRDLNNFAALHREGVVAVGVIVTRGPRLNTWLRSNVTGGESKYGASTTWWDKLIPRVDLGGGGECPLLLIGIEPERVVTGAAPARRAGSLFD